MRHLVLLRQVKSCVLLTTLASLSTAPAWAQATPPSTPAPSASARVDASASAPTPSAPSAPSAPASATPSGPASASASAAPEALIPPKLLNDVQPVYPEAARQQAIAASVLLEIDIDVAGRVENASVLQTAEVAGYGFDEAALAAARLLVFEPAREAGLAVPVRLTYRFRFVPDVPAPAVPAPQTPKPASQEAPKAAKPPATGQLWGSLAERGTRLPLSGVKVTVFRGEGASAEGYETETDAEGKFRLSGLGAGNWRLLADPDGYYPLRTTEEINNDSRTEVRYIIEKSAYNPYDVVVDTERVQREVNHIAISAQQAERIPGTFGDVLAVVQNFPGVALGGGGLLGDSGFVIRGAAPKDSRIMVSNVDVPLLYHFGNVRSVLPGGMVEAINFYPGNFSVEYGRATGGIVDVDLKNLNRKAFGGYLDANFFDASLYLELPITDTLSVAVAGRRSYIDALLNAAFSSSGTSILAPRYYDAQALVSFRPSAAHQLKGFFFFSDDRFEVLFAKPLAASATAVITDVGLGTTFYRGVAEYKYVPGPKFENELKLSLGQDRNTFNLGTLLNLDVTLLQGQVRDTARYAFNEHLALRGGVDYMFQDYNRTAKLPQTRREGDGNAEVDITASQASTTSGIYHSTAGFAELELKPWQGMLAIPGFRFEHFSRTDKFAASPRLVVRQSLNDQWTIKGGVGLFQQEPTFDETAKGTGNPNLGLEKAIHYSAGVEYRPLPHVHLDVTGFYKTLYDTVGRTEALTSTGGTPTPLNYSNGADGRVIGFELLAKHDFSKNFFGWVAYTLSKAERRDEGATKYRLFDYDQTHILTVLANYRLPRNWEIGARFRYVTGSLYTPVVGAAYDADADEYKPISGPVNSDRVNAFHQLDIRIDKRWIYESWMLNAYIDIQNVYNQVNTTNVSYNYDYSSSVPEQGLPIIPVIGLRGEF